MLRKSSIVLMAVSLAVIPLTAQTSWMKTYGDEYHDEWGMIIEETADGGFVVFGSISSPAGGGDMWLLKTDAQGDTQWTKTYGGQAPEYCYSGQETKDGGYILAGSTESFGEGNTDIWLVKTNAVGDTQWTKTYGSYGYDEAYSVQQTDDGGYIVTGTHDGFTSPWDGDMWLLKTDSKGDTLWTKTWAAKQPTMTDAGNCVSQTSDGGYIIACYADYSQTTQNGIVVMKTDNKGDTVWAYRDTIWFMVCVAQTSDDAYVATGFNNHDLFLIKLNSEGSLVWKKCLGDARQDYRDFGWCVQESPGGCVVAGQYSYNSTSGDGDVWLLKFDSDGDTSWTKTYGSNPGYDEAFWVQPTSDGGYILTGSTETWSSGGSDLFIMKTDSLGVEVKEEPSVAHQLDFEIASPIGSRIVLRYNDHPKGFHAQVFDASGRKVDEIESQTQSGTLTWGSHHNPGVYFIVPTDGEVNAYKVILIK
ncbi:T9SS type A sorting domain-containing protein [candidate division WOR-3 bacterium]|nr:T9SS type A sorting domain-containing protein [candidate division WOR-3 bacterium]